MAKPRPVAKPHPAAKPRPAATPRPARSRAAAASVPVVSTRPRLGLAVLSGAAVLGILDAGVLGGAIPSLHTGLGATAAGARLAVTVPLVAMAMTLPVAAGIGDRAGAARLLRWSLAVLAAASALAALAWGLAPLLAMRALQGAAAGVMVPAALTLAGRLRPGRGWATALLGGGFLLAPALAPALGAWLGGGLPWRVTLLAAALLGAAALVGARLWLPVTAGEPGARPDVAGMATAALALAALLLALLQGAAWGWTSYAALGLLCGSVLALALFAVVELSVPHPLVDLTALRPRAAAVGPLLLALCAAVLGAGFLEVPLLLQGAGHLGALQVATSLVLPAVLAAAAMAASAALTARIGARWTVVAGLLLVALATYLLHGVAPSAAGRLALLACVRAAGLGVALAPLTATVVAATRKAAGAAAVAALCVVLPTAAGLALVSSALVLPPWSPGSQGAAGTVQERLVLLHGDMPLPLSGPTFLPTVLVTAAVAAFGALAALRLPSGGRSGPG
ncbi:MAG: MFS transporter [Chloroflexi bacterium]|nr:MAG: MFS transporter [Chloroflexota bacterium]